MKRRHVQDEENCSMVNGMRYMMVTVIAIVLSATTLLAKPTLNGTYTIGGVAPDYATILQALADLDTTGVSGPVTFNIRDGVYNESFFIGEYPGASENHHVTFQSETGSNANVLIQAKSNGSSPLWSLDTASHLTFKNLSFRNDTTAAWDLWEMKGNARNISFLNCHFESAAGGDDYALWFYPDTAWNISILGCSFDTFYLPIYMEAYYDRLHGIAISDNSMNFTSDHPIYVGYADEVEIHGNEITAFCDEAIYLYGCTGVSVIENYTANAEDEFIYIDDCQDVLIAGNEADTAYYSYYVNESEEIEIIKNYCHRTWGEFIYIEYSNGLLVDSNEVDSSGAGIYVYETNHVTVTSNTVHFSWGDAVSVEHYDSIDNLLIAHNSGDGYIGGYAIHVYINHGDINILENNFSGYIDEYAVYTYQQGGNAHVEGNQFTGTIEEYGIYMEGCDNATITDNTMDSVYYFAIYAFDCGGEVLIAGNAFHWSDYGGIYLEEAEWVAIRDNEFTVAGSYGIEVNYVDNGLSISNNAIDTVWSYGIYTYECYGETDIHDNVVGYSDNSGAYCAYAENLNISNNDLGTCHSYGIEVYDIDSGLTVRNNKMENTSGNDGLYGIYLSDVENGTHYVHVTGNSIVNTNEYMGIYLNNVGAPHSASTFLANNMISGTTYGIEIDHSYHVEVFNNSVSQFGDANSAVYLYNDTGVNVFNNIFSYNSTDTTSRVLDVFNCDFQMDFNVYNITSDNDIAGNAGTLAEHQDSNGVDLNSFETDPLFYNDTFDLHICNAADLFEAGDAITAFVSVDMDGVFRNVIAPTIGAQELVEGQGNPVADFDYANAALTVEFENTSVNNASGFDWDFGDGNSSADEDPTHTYAASGTYIIEFTAENECGSNSKVDTIVVEDTAAVGIQPRMLTDHLSIYPNPTSGWVTIELEGVSNGPVLITVFDAMGMVAMQTEIREPVQRKFSMDASNLASGVYLLTVKQNDRISTLKLVKGGR